MYKTIMISILPFSPAHFSILSGWFTTEAELVQWGGPKLIFPLDDAQMLAMLDEGKTTPPARLCWMAEQDNVYIGHAQLAFDWKNGNATLGRVGIAPSVRGQGLAEPMLRLVLAQAFAFSTIMRVELNVFTFNTPAIRTYQRLGFVTEGTRRSCTPVAQDRWDGMIMSMLRSEYTDLNKNTPSS
jgi:RimJ/RimL family protein N-acetyltransferase